MDLLGSNNNVDIMEGRKGRNKISTSKMLKFVKCNRLCLSNLEEKLRILFLKHMADSSGETAHTSKDSLEIRQCDCCCFSTSTKKKLEISFCLVSHLLTHFCCAVGWPYSHIVCGTRGQASISPVISIEQNFVATKCEPSISQKGVCVCTRSAHIKDRRLCAEGVKKWR
jgi:hypothetical protein